MEALYCLLPVRNLGFAFCIDGPFELIASRGDLHEGSWRNQAKRVSLKRKGGAK